MPDFNKDDYLATLTSSLTTRRLVRTVMPARLMPLPSLRRTPRLTLTQQRRPRVSLPLPMATKLRRLTRTARPMRNPMQTEA